MTLLDRLTPDPDNVPRNKLIVYAAQVVLGLTIFILEIVVFTAQDSKIVGNNGWPFGLCFLSVPAWIYLALAPRHERTRRAANPNVMLMTDSVFTILWLSAFASQAAYNSDNLCGKACAVSKGIVGLAFFETLFWVVSTLISAYVLRFYQQNGDLPGYEKIGGTQNIDPHKSDFEANMEPDDIHYDANDDESQDGYYNNTQSTQYTSSMQYTPSTQYPEHGTLNSKTDSPPYPSGSPPPEGYFPDHYGMHSTSSRHSDPYAP
ncbi:hypothetical protein GGS21DRAFT_339691 [Xylaria nigripes]|nr:hypothetical protein GGS21DRAFT_339691 [Xylaria nigripes]